MRVNLFFVATFRSAFLAFAIWFPAMAQAAGIIAGARTATSVTSGPDGREVVSIAPPVAGVSHNVSGSLTTGLSEVAGNAGASAAALKNKDPLAAANVARDKALNNGLSPTLKELAKAGTACKAGTCVGYVNALKTEKTAKQQEYDACMAAWTCSPIRAAGLSSALFRLKSAYEQTVRQGVAVGDLKWVAVDNVVPADYFDGLVGVGAVGVGAALRLGGAKGVQGKVGTGEGAVAVTSNKVGALDNIATNINGGQQGKHILGNNNFIPGRSSINSRVDPQQLLNGVHSGIYPVVATGSRGQPVVDFRQPIGIDAVSGLPTQYGTIHSGSRGAHIVPTNPMTVGGKK